MNKGDGMAHGMGTHQRSGVHPQDRPKGEIAVPGDYQEKPTEGSGLGKGVDHVVQDLQDADGQDGERPPRILLSSIGPQEQGEHSGGDPTDDAGQDGLEMGNHPRILSIE